MTFCVYIFNQYNNDLLSKNRKKNKEGRKKKLVEVTKIIEEEKSKTTEIKRTNAEIAFQKMQEKMVSDLLIKKLYTIIQFHSSTNHCLQQTERIKQKASMTHKQRVEEFNRHLDSLTEHFDIPKVSWTKWILFAISSSFFMYTCIIICINNVIQNSYLTLHLYKDVFYYNWLKKI